MAKFTGGRVDGCGSSNLSMQMLGAIFKPLHIGLYRKTTDALAL